MIKAAMNDYAASLSKTWEHDRSQTVGASEIGSCIRKTFWVKNEGDPVYGVPRDPEYVDGWGGKVRGTFYENTFWAPAVKTAFGDNVLYVGKDQRTFVKGFLSGTPDALLINQKSDALAHIGITDIESDCIDFDCKTADPRINLSEPKPEHVFQVHVQLGLFRELTPHKPVYAILSYTDASFWDVVLEFPIKFNPMIYEVAKQRAVTIMTATSAADLKPEGWIAGGKECEYCPFTKACGVVRTRVPDKTAALADPQFVAEITDMAREIQMLETENESTSIKIKTLQNEMKNRLREKGHRHIPGVVSWSPVKGRQSYNQKAIREEAIKSGIDIEQFSTVGEATDRLIIQLTEQSRSAA